MPNNYIVDSYVLVNVIRKNGIVKSLIETDRSLLVRPLCHNKSLRAQLVISATYSGNLDIDHILTGVKPKHVQRLIKTTDRIYSTLPAPSVH